MTQPAVAEGEEPKEPVEETEEILKSEADNLRAKAARADELETKETNREGYTGRKVKEATESLETRIRELEDEKSSWETGDKDVDTLRTKAGKDHLTNVQTAKDLADERRVFNETKLQSLAENLAIKYNIDASILGEAKTEDEMENIALKAERERLQAEGRTPANLNLGGGKVPAGGSFQAIEESFIKGLISAEEYGREARKAGKL